MVRSRGKEERLDEALFVFSWEVSRTDISYVLQDKMGWGYGGWGPDIGR